MFCIVSYDITNDKRRIKLAKTIRDFGDRVQYSVFECILTEDLLSDMLDKIENIIDKEKDSVRVYKLCSACEKKIQITGQGDICKIEEVYII